MPALCAFSRMADYIKIELQSMSNLDQLLGTDPKMEQMFRQCLRKVMSRARSGAVRELRTKVGKDYKHSHGDPRDAYKAVKYVVYKRALGGNISILNKRKASNIRLTGGSSRLDQYYGSDRGFILRFLNSGTPKRDARRGQIASSGMFSNIGDKYIQQALVELDKLIQSKVELRANQI